MRRDQGIGLIRGDGTADFFRKSDTSYYAEADAFETLSEVTDSTGTWYVVETQDGRKKYFDRTLGLLRRIVDRTGRAQTLTYDDEDGDSVADELTEFDDGLGGVTAFAYTAGLLTSVTDGNAVTWHYEHDATDRTLERAYSPTKVGTTYFAEQKFEYDSSKLMTRHEDRVQGTTTYGYDANLRVASVTHNGATETRSPTEVQGLGTSVVAASAATGQTTAAGGTHTYAYDAQGRSSPPCRRARPRPAPSRRPTSGTGTASSARPARRTPPAGQTWSRRSSTTPAGWSRRSRARTRTGLGRSRPPSGPTTIAPAGT